MPKRTVSPDGYRWCNKGEHHVPVDGFSRNQGTCRACRRIHYARNNYNAGKKCPSCDVRIVNKAQRCAKCWAASQRGRPRKHGRSRNGNGYIVLSGHYDHPNANNRGLVLEHTKVMTEILGRPLRPGENVHHKNGIRDDNRPENLELWTSSQPPGQRVTDLVAWAREIIETYGAEVSKGAQ